VNYLRLIGEVLLFPGFVFTAVIGLVTTWIDRKVTARVQMRVGPPFLQPFYDVTKYMVKETCVPAGSSKLLFLGAPLLGLAAVTVASTILWRVNLWPETAFIGDLIVILYLLTMPAIAVVLGSFASANPIASVGGSREMKLILAYELPFILACLVPVIKSGTIELSQLLTQPAAAGAPSGIIALIIAILCMQAKLTLVPFDMPEAETELTGGAYVEYSGPPLGIFKLTRAMMLFTMPVFLITVLWGGIPFQNGGVAILLGILKYVALIVITVLIRNTAPRIRIDQAMKFFWGPVTLFGLCAVILAFVEVI
jgi:NADH-quinone oxidoreductase subunit H